jgi:hypothetical protein
MMVHVEDVIRSELDAQSPFEPFLAGDDLGARPHAIVSCLIRDSSHGSIFQPSLGPEAAAQRLLVLR